jgi:hypothetical protein
MVHYIKMTALTAAWRSVKGAGEHAGVFYSQGGVTTVRTAATQIPWRSLCGQDVVILV